MRGAFISNKQKQDNIEARKQIISGAKSNIKNSIEYIQYISLYQTLIKKGPYTLKIEGWKKEG